MLNYLKETLSFLDAVKREPLSPRAQVLWHYLLYFNNQAAVALDNGDYYWPVWFTVDNGVLAIVMGIKDSRHIYNYRRVLMDRGWLQFRVGQVLGQGEAARMAAQWAAQKPIGEYALTPFTPGFQKRALDQLGGHGKTLVWAEDMAVTETAGEESSYIDINNYKSINKIASITAPPTDIAPSTRPNPFDEIAERGRQAALRRVTDEDMKQYFQTKEEP